MVTWGVQYRVTAKLICRSWRRLSSVRNILPRTSTLDPTRAHVQTYTIPYPYSAERRRTRPYMVLLYPQLPPLLRLTRITDTGRFVWFTVMSASEQHDQMALIIDMDQVFTGAVIMDVYSSWGSTKPRRCLGTHLSYSYVCHNTQNLWKWCGGYTTAQNESSLCWRKFWIWTFRNCCTKPVTIPECTNPDDTWRTVSPKPSTGQQWNEP